MYVPNLMRSLNTVKNEIRICLVLWKKILVEQMVLLVERTHYRRREDQSSLSPHPSKATMDCIFCHEILSSFSGGKQEEIPLQRKRVKRKRKTN